MIKYFLNIRPYGTEENYFLTLNEIPEIPYKIKENNDRAKEEKEAEKKNPLSKLMEDWKALEEREKDNPPGYQELFLNPTLLETSELPTYTDVMETDLHKNIG